MKFAKQLREEVVPEWRKAYMNYKQGKKYLKAIEAALDQLNDNHETAHRDNSKHHGPLSIDTEAVSPIERPATAYSPQYPDSPTGTTPIIRKGRGSQRSYDAIHRPPPLRSTALLPPSSSLGSALDGTDQDSSAPHDLQQHQIGHEPSIATLTDRQVLPRSDSFVAQIGEAAKTQSHNVFKSLQQKELESVTKLKVLKQQLYVADEWKRRQDAKAEATGAWYQAEWSRVRDGLGTFMEDPTQTEDVTIAPLRRPHLNPLGQVKHTTVGFSTGTETIKPRNGVVNNGKAPENNLRSRDNRTTVDGHPVCSASEHNQVLIDDEENRRQHLHHKVARSRIKAAIYEFYRSMEMLKNYRVLNKTGFIKIMKKFDKTAGWKASKEFQASKLKTAYFVTSTILDDLILETEDLYIEKFENGHRSRGMTKLRIPAGKNRLPTFFMMALCIALYLDFVVGITSPSMFRTYYPLILIGLILVVLCWPLRMFRFGARKWFLQSIWRIVASGYYKVEFRDFFIADEMNSLVYSIEQFEFAICAYTHQWNDLTSTCPMGHMWITPFVTALPAWFRFLQCLRRYRDTLEWFPHLLNAGKYSCSLLQILVYFSFRHYGGNSLKAAYIVVSLITSSYTFAWDVHMDWGLLQFGKHGGAAFGNPFLRPELVYPRKWVYYLAIVLDFFGRFSWILRFLAINVNVMIISFILAFGEVLRRWMWNFFRLENEHLNNCGHFRAIKDIPLPFHIHVAEDSDEDENEEEEMDEDAEDVAAKDNGSDTEDGEQGGIGSGTDESKQRHHLAASTSQASFPVGDISSQTGVIRRPSPKRKPSGSSYSGPPFGLDRSSTFVDDALGQAGFATEQLEQLASTTYNKFYDRRDFESRIDGDEETYRGHKARSNKAPSRTTASRSTGGLGLGIDSSVGGTADGARPVEALDATSTKSKRRLGKMLKSEFRRWRDGSDDEDDYDSDDDER
ncbi:Xenotropic and polytropic retrovirus receptor 1 [Linnemannia hyalina]|uniref:Xenotropic and polytropic retrovirus receptor 1 n=1 Tax=Linnemannia hyalina TaxID=64524 RepID=A0A9P8BRD3_9FUNG|nr:Xenotropic and polytropic retrovirus receptor 1 [Linnemannia hyalina]